MLGHLWIKGLNRIQTPKNLPITLQGGEPTFHPDFYRIVRKIRKDLNIDLLTNGLFDVDTFMKKIPPTRLARPSKYVKISLTNKLAIKGEIKYRNDPSTT